MGINDWWRCLLLCLWHESPTLVLGGGTADGAISELGAPSTDATTSMEPSTELPKKAKFDCAQMDG